MAKAEGILRSIATGLSNGVLEAINGNVQAAKRKAKGYRTNFGKRPGRPQRRRIAADETSARRGHDSPT